MFSFFKNLFKETNPNMFNITKTNGKFFIVDRHGFSATGTGGYSRRRDAVRGAARRGLTIA